MTNHDDISHSLPQHGGGGQGQQQQQQLGQTMGGGGGGGDQHVLPTGDEDVNLEELCSHENPRNLYSDWKKVGEG